ncbi:MAG TPA: winged helix-turn-helix domain-containing protein [Candidatus Parabacteroides intestinigallinarum]|uniref:Winged helix-turn-helix domain-containing protein n=1 Tax=Candidatus Parabacteroides intestinigallinarum TaxID=2838722 RepID=A0A9D1XQJ4_9BACT|nr:winged helix-turn-helix domain-containing protein [Candidatus Parabacteroides intestinigallinarum]
MTKGSIGLNAGAICNILSDGQYWSFEALRAKSALSEADLWSAIGWLARENKIEIDNSNSHPSFRPGTNFNY